jgi:hypothetical protein
VDRTARARSLRVPSLSKGLAAIGTVIGLWLVAVTGGCTSTERVPITHAASPVSSPPPICTGQPGEPLLRAFFDDLTNGRTGPLTTYFVSPRDFTRWSDPTSGELTLMPGPGNDTVTLDGLQAHLNDLQRNGASVALTSFDDSGYQRNDASALGGGFTFGIRGRAERHEPVTQGDGFGLIDCATGKLKELFIFNW